MCVRVRTCAPEILSLGENFKKRYPHLLYTWFFTSFHPLEAVKCQLCSSRNIINSGVCVCVFVCSMGWWRCTIRPKEKIGSKRVVAMEDDAEKPKHRKVKKRGLTKQILQLGRCVHVFAWELVLAEEKNWPGHIRFLSHTISLSLPSLHLQQR